MWLSILIAVILLIFFWLRNKSLYIKGFGDRFNRTLVLHIINSYNTLNSPPGKALFEIHNNFFNYSANLILKFIFFIVVKVITQLLDTSIFSFIFILIALGDWNVFSQRRKFYINIPENQKKYYFYPYKACICSPIYQTILYILTIFF